MWPAVALRHGKYLAPANGFCGVNGALFFLRKAMLTCGSK